MLTMIESCQNTVC